MAILEPGCYVDGAWGWRGTLRVIEIAQENGFTLSDEDQARKDTFEKTAVCDLAGDLWDFIVDTSDKAEEYLNAHCAPPEHHFAWYEGEFYLWSDNAWAAVP